MKKLNTPIWCLLFFVIILDQLTKIIVKTTFQHGEMVRVVDWFYLYFVENNGFAFGIELFGDIGKLTLTLLRVIFVLILFRWLVDFINQKQSQVLIFSFTLIIAGAVGNLIDSIFYGVIFGESPLFFGKVVDMFYFPFMSGFYPDWIPFLGGKEFIFFRYIFNIADTAITSGAILFLLFYKKLKLKES